MSAAAARISALVFFVPIVSFFSSDHECCVMRGKLLVVRDLVPWRVFALSLA